ncbi:hypothetical protein [Acidithiobacillus acidisediminis]|uniref:hypothetical protein n=1 Tax=Acidithiobacillus acidisediminis TaxID=2937799 RepID=UPI00200C7AA6|nr:hypothetical protein [Acidithiobacillus sp. S30A2]
MDIPVIEPAVISRYVPEHREEYLPPKTFRRTDTLVQGAPSTTKGKAKGKARGVQK